MTCLRPLLVVSSPFRYKVRFKTIGGDDIRFLVQQLFALASRNVTHCREAIDMMSGLLLYRVFSLHIQFACHLVAIVTIHIGIQCFVVTGNRTANRGSMSRKQSGNSRQLFLHIQSGHRQHPFIEQSSNRLVFQLVVMIETFDHLTYRIRKNTRLIVVAIGMDRIYPKVLPHRIEKDISFSEVGFEVHQDNWRQTWHIPATNLDFQLINRFCMFLPICK